jgi:hypothetical protein
MYIRKNSVYVERLPRVAVVAVGLDDVDLHRRHQRLHLLGRDVVIRQILAREDGLQSALNRRACRDVSRRTRREVEDRPMLRTVGVRLLADHQIAVQLLVGYLLVERGRVARRQDVDRHVGVGAMLELTLQILRRLRLRGHDRDVRRGLALGRNRCDAEDAAAHQRGDQNGGDEECPRAHTLHVLALGDEPDVMHRGSLLPLPPRQSWRVRSQ